MTDGDSIATERTVPARGPRVRDLVVLTATGADRHPLPATGRITIGRGSWCDVRIDHPSLSRDHAALVLRERTLLVDLGSANGTTLRGVRLPPDTEVELAANETFVAGDVALVVQERHASASAPAAMQHVLELARRVAAGTISVLITGETGVGKDVLASAIHAMSPRAAAPFVRINCAAINDSLFESELFGHVRGAFTGAHASRRGMMEAADGGTLLLDELGELSPALQAKVLRAVEDRQVTPVGAVAPIAVDVRFLAATNRDLAAEVARGSFRQDLYFRLAAVELAVPPLRQRPDEIDGLARQFAAEAAARLARPAPTLAPDALRALRAHAWPGNVRELRNAIERAVLVTSGGTITAGELRLGGAPVAAAPSDPDPERARILDALAQCAGNQTRAAELLGISRRTLVKRLAAFDIPRPRTR